MRYNENGHVDGCTVTVDDYEVGGVALQVYYRTWHNENNDIERVYRAEDAGEKEDLCAWIDEYHPAWWLDIVDAVDAASVDFWR